MMNLFKWKGVKEKKKNVAAAEPPPEEIEEELDKEWLATHEVGIKLMDAWSDIPCKGLAASGSKERAIDTAIDAPVPVLDWAVDKESGPAFRGLFISLLKDWNPTPEDATLPMCYLSHLCSALTTLVDALTRVDTSMPRGRAPHQYQAVVTTLTCLEIASRSPLNIRYMVERGLLTDLSKLIEAVVAGLWPLALPLACLRNSNDSPDGCRLDDKLAQVKLRIGVVSQCMKLVHATVVTQHDVGALKSPELVPTSSIRKPMTKVESAGACLSGTPNLAKVLSWSTVMLMTHVVHAVDDDDCLGLFTAVWQMLDTMKVIVRPVITTKQGVDKERLNQVLESELAQTLITCLDWPEETSYRLAETGQLGEDSAVPVVDPFDPSMYTLRSISNSRRDRYSQIQRAALEIAVSVIDDHPEALRKLLPAGLIDACGATAAWHVVHYSTPEALEATAERVQDSHYVVQDSLSLPNTSTLDEHKNIETPTVLATSLLTSPDHSLADVLDKQSDQLQHVLELLKELSCTAYGVREHVHEQLVKKIAAKEKSLGLQSRRPLTVPDVSELWEGAQKLELLALEMFSGTFKIKSGSVEKPNLTIALRMQRNHYQLQIFTLSAIISYINENTANASRHHDPMRATVPHGGLDALNTQGVHKLLLESDAFYLSCFELASRTKECEREPRRPIWDLPDGADYKCIRVLIRNACKHVFHCLLSITDRDIKPDILAVLRALKTHTHSSDIVVDMGELLLQVCRTQDLTTVLEEPSVLDLFVETLRDAFQHQHEIICSLKGGSFLQQFPNFVNSFHSMPSMTLGKPAMSSSLRSPPSTPLVVSKVGSTSSLKTRAKTFCNSPDKTPPFPSPLTTPPLGPLQVQVQAQAQERIRVAIVTKKSTISSPPLSRCGTGPSQPPSKLTPASPPLFTSSPPAPPLAVPLKSRAKAKTIVLAPTSPQLPSIGSLPSPFCMQPTVPDVPPGVTEDDHPTYCAARNVVLNVFESISTVPCARATLLRGGSYVLLACISERSLRLYGVRLLSSLLKTTGAGLPEDKLCDVLKHTVMDVVSKLATGPSGLTLTILKLIQDVVGTLEIDEAAQLISITGNNGEPGVRRRVIQNLHDGFYEKFVEVLRCSVSDGADPHELGFAVLETIGYLLKGNHRAKAQFKQEVGWVVLGDEILRCVDNGPSQSMFDQLFNVLVGGENSETIENEGLLPVILHWCTLEVFSSNQALILDLTKRLNSILSFSTHNLERASRVGILEVFVDMLVRWEDRDIRAQLIECYHRVGRHCITVKQLKPLFTALRDQQGQKRMFLLPWVIRILRSLAQSQQGPDKDRRKPSVDDNTIATNSLGTDKGAPTRSPPAFFDFSSEHSGLKLPDLTSYPSSNGYSICMWLRIEADRPPCLDHLEDIEHYRPHLYALEADDGSGLTAFFEMDHTTKTHRLHLTVCQPGESPSSAVIDTVCFTPKRWYHLYISHSCGKRIISKAEVKVYVDGTEKWRGALKYPRSNVQYSSCIGTNMKGYRQHTLLNNFYGQVCCVYLIDGAVSSAVVSAIHGLGPAYQSNFAPADREKIVSTLGLADSAKTLFNEFHSSKIYMLYNPLASQGGMLVNVAGLNQMDEIGERTDLSGKQQDLVLAAVLPGTQLCLTQALRQVLGSMGGLMVLFPLLALLGEHRSALIPDEPAHQTTQLKTSIVPFLVSNLLSLFHDLFKTHPLFICEIRDNKLHHVLNMLLKPIAPFLDKSNIERINLMIHKIWNEETWKEGVQYLLLDLSIWVQTPVTIQLDLFSTIYNKLAKAVGQGTGSAGRWFSSMKPFAMILDQLTWFLYYDEPSPVEGIVDRDMKKRMYGKRGITDHSDIRAVRCEALESASLLLSDCASDDVLALCANLLDPLNDLHQLEDLIEFLLDLLESKREALVEPFYKHRGLDILFSFTTLKSSALRQGCISCIGVMTQHSKKIFDLLCCNKPFGLAALAENLTNAFCAPTYKTLRDVMLYTVHKPQRGLRQASEQPCRPLPSGSKMEIKVPAVVPVIMKLVPTADFEIKEVVIADFEGLVMTKGNAGILCDMGWSRYAADLLVALEVDAATCDPARVEAARASLLNLTSQVLFDAMLLPNGWKQVDGFIDAVYECEKVDAYSILVTVFMHLCDLYLDAVAKGRITPPSEKDEPPAAINAVYFSVFIEDLLCFHPTLSSCLKAMRFGIGFVDAPGLKQEDNDNGWVEVTDEGDRASTGSSTAGSPTAADAFLSMQRKGYHEPAELQVDPKSMTWGGWSLALKALSVLFALDLYKAYVIKKEIDTSFTYASAQLSRSRTTTFLTRPGGLTRIATRFIRLCLTYVPPKNGDAPSTPPATKDIELLLSYVKSVIAYDKISDRTRERFEDAYTSNDRARQSMESRGRTLTLLNAVAAYVTKTRHKNKTLGVPDDVQLQLEGMKCMKFIFNERQSLIDKELTEGSPRQHKAPEWLVWMRTNNHSTRADLERYDAIVLEKGWQTLQMVMLPISDNMCQEVGSLWMDIAQRRRKTASQEQRELFKLNEEAQNHVLKIGSKPPAPLKCEFAGTYKDLQRTSEKYWKQLLMTVTNERGAWALQPKSTLVRRSVQEVGGMHCKLRPKLVYDPKLTDHANITSQKEANLKPLTDEAVKVHSHIVGNEEDDDNAETCEEDDNIPPPPSKSGWKFNCEVISLMQGWSASFQIIPESSVRCLWVIVDEVNTSIVQAMNPASEHLAEKPKDDKYPIDTLKHIVMRRYRLRMTAIEFYFIDGTSILLNFEKKEDVLQIFRVILHKINPKAKNLKTTEIPKNPVSSFRRSKLTDKWVRREISNFEYLMGLNFYSSRTVNDLTQYPVMPWVLCDYHSHEINLENEAVYRDLSQPLGCLGPDARRSEDRTKEIKMKYESLESIGMTPFHFGSHYSNSGFALFYLLRLEPYTTAGIILQGAKFDHADRLFDSLAQTWHGVTHSAADVKELVPEFFYQPEIFTNNNKIRFGTRQDGRELDNVELPPWCTGAHDFVRIHREALESEYVSAHLHEWIDLIFGCKQFGDEAVDAINTYHPYSYEQVVSDINFAEEDEHTKQRIISHIDNFGQTPIQLFRRKHPPRNPILHIYQPFRSRPVMMTPQGVVHRILQGKAIVKLCIVSSSAEKLVAIGENGVVAIHSFKTLGTIEGRTHSAFGVQSMPSISSLGPSTPVTHHASSSSLTKSPRTPSLTLDAKAVEKANAAALASVMCVSPTVANGPTTPSLTKKKSGIERKKLFAFEASCSFQSRAVQAGMKKCPATENSYVYTSLPDREMLFASGLWNNSATISELVAANTNPIVLQSLFGHNDVVTCLAVDNANTHLVTGSKDTTLLLWTLRLRNSFPLAVLKATLIGHADEVLCVDINTELDIIASGGADGVAILYDVCQGKYERTLKHPRGGKVNLIKITSQGTVIFYSKDDLFLYLFSINGALLACVDTTVRIHCLTLTKDSRYLITGGEPRDLRQSSTIFLRSTADLSLVHKFPSASSSPVRSIAVHKDEQVMVAGLEDGCIVFYSS
eukprot:TRINITY_DN11622_c0_g1_i6.p1 TRINITY_DN11622_c0_g1~~TRINITY_DN11622_c0_g1_i6.p1  ORF type:complete len:3514 (+),score=1103.06 TRINITY_DN11622_c0_g1_i6:89-10630(+)